MIEVQRFWVQRFTVKGSRFQNLYFRPVTGRRDNQSTREIDFGLVELIYKRFRVHRSGLMVLGSELSGLVKSSVAQAVCLVERGSKNANID